MFLAGSCQGMILLFYKLFMLYNDSNIFHTSEIRYDEPSYVSLFVDLL